MSSAVAAAPEFSRFRNDIQLSGTPFISPQKFAKRLAIRQHRLAQLAHVNQQSLRRAPAAKKLQTFLLGAVQVLNAAYDVCKNIEQTLSWFLTHPINSFDRKTPVELVSAGQIANLLRYISSLEPGFLG